MKMGLFLKKILPVALATILSLSPAQVLAASSGDLTGHWAEKVITQWQEKGLIKGYSDGVFKPNNKITLSEFVTIMNNALGFEDVAPLNFTDTVAGNWYYKAVAKAVAAGYVKGYQDGTFRPNNTITRAEASVMIATAMKLSNRGSVAEDFTAAADLPGWAKGSIGAIVEAQYMSGYPDGSFGAKKSITRAEAVSALNRVMVGGYSDDMVITQAGTIVKNKVVESDLIIDKKVGSGEVFLNNVEVMGSLIIEGCNKNSVHLENVKVHNKVRVNKDEVRLYAGGNTTLPKVELNALAGLYDDTTFAGEIGTVTITNDTDRSKRVELNVPVQKLLIQANTSVAVNADIQTVEVNRIAKVELAETVSVQNMIANADTTLAGSGVIETLEINTNDMTADKTVYVKKIEAADGVKVPQHLLLKQN